MNCVIFRFISKQFSHKTMKKMFISLLFIGYCLHALAQDKNAYSYFLPETKMTDQNARIEVNQKGDTVLVAFYRALEGVNKTNNTFTKVYKGTPFFKNGWFKGKTVEKNGHEAEYLMAYNQQKGVLHVMANPLLEAVMMKPTEFVLQNHRFVLLKNQYYEPIYEGKTMILKEHQCLLHSKSSVQNTGYEASGSESEYEGEFIKTTKYYWYEDGKLSGIPTGKRFFKLFGNQAKEMEMFAKDRQLTPTTEKGMIEIVKNFNPL